MIREIALTMLFGKPLMMYGGIATLLLLLITSAVGFLNYKRITRFPFKWHIYLAFVTIIFSIVHGLFGLSLYFNF